MIAIPKRVNNLLGRTFSLLTVRKYDGVREGHAYWLCDCACGTRDYSMRGAKLVAWEASGRAISCGCYRSNPLVRRAARLTMSESDRRAAAGGKTIKRKSP